MFKLIIQTVQNFTESSHKNFAVYYLATQRPYEELVAFLKSVGADAESFYIESANFLLYGVAGDTTTRQIEQRAQESLERLKSPYSVYPSIFSMHIPDYHVVRFRLDGIMYVAYYQPVMVLDKLV